MNLPNRWDDEEMTKEAILERYRRANEMAVVTSNRTLFSSLQDIFTLLKYIDELEAQLEELKRGQQT